MKNITITTVEKGTENIKQQINVSDVPETIAELAAFAETQTEAVQSRLYRLFTAGFEAKAKATFSDGTTNGNFLTVVTRSGRRTQAGLLAAISDLIITASTVTPEVIPEIVALMSLATTSFLGHTDEYYDTFDALKARVQAAETETENA